MSTELFSDFSDVDASTATGPATTGPGGWDRIDLTPVVNGEWEPPQPTIMLRTDGRGLLYPGLVHTFQGEPESGKSMLAQAVAAGILAAGGRVLYLDFESDRGTVVSRIMALGAPAQAVLERMHYLNPDTRPDPNPEAWELWQGILATPYDLAIIDGVNEALSVYGYSLMDNDDVTAWGRALPRALATGTGAAVVCVDHVTKSKDGRNRFAIGAQAKLSYLTGASYTIEPTEYLAPGRRGVLSIRVGKDRPGGVRAFAAPDFQQADRTQAVAQAVFDSEGREPGDRIRYTLENPLKMGHSPLRVDQKRPTAIMAAISAEYEKADAEGRTITVTTARKLVKGTSELKTNAVNALLAEGYLQKQSGANKPHLFKRRFAQD